MNIPMKSTPNSAYDFKVSAYFSDDVFGKEIYHFYSGKHSIHGVCCEMLQTPTILAHCLLHMRKRQNSSNPISMMTSVQQKVKYMTRSSEIKAVVSNNAVFNTCIKENLQLNTGLLQSGAFNHGLTTSTKKHM
jgi:hypothetical protein